MELCISNKRNTPKFCIKSTVSSLYLPQFEIDFLNELFELNPGYTLSAVPDGYANRRKIPLLPAYVSKGR